MDLKVKVWIVVANLKVKETDLQLCRELSFSCPKEWTTPHYHAFNLLVSKQCLRASTIHFFIKNLH